MFTSRFGWRLLLPLFAVLPITFGCGGDESGDPTPDTPYEEAYSGYPEGIEPGATFENGAWWLAHPERFAVVIWSGTGCAVVPGTLEVTSPTELRITTLPPTPGQSCTTAATAFTFEFLTPEGMSVDAPVAIHIDDDAPLTLVPPAS